MQQTREEQHQYILPNEASRVAAKKDQENFEREKERLQSEYNTMHDMLDRELNECKTSLANSEGQAAYFREECTRLQKKLKENDETIRSQVGTNADMGKKVDYLKSKVRRLKGENSVINEKLKELLISMDISRMDESQHSSFLVASGPSLPPAVKPVAPNVFASLGDATKPPLQNIQEYLQLYTQKVSRLGRKLKDQRALLQEQRKENEGLRFRLEEVKKLDAVLVEQIKLEVRVKRIRLKQLIFRSFGYLTVKDLLRVSCVCATFYSQCSDYLTDVSYWRTTCRLGFEAPRHQVWLTFIKSQYPRDREFLKFYAEHSVDSNKGSGGASKRHATLKSVSAFDDPLEDKKDEDSKVTERKEPGFFDCSYTFLSNVDPVHGAANDNSSVVDYSLMNADSARCDPEEIFWPDFLAMNSYGSSCASEIVVAPTVVPKSNVSLPAGTKRGVKDEIEQILTDMQRIFSFNHYRQGMTFVACFLHVVMRQNRRDIYRMLNVLLDEPYYLKKLYSDDFYLLNLIIFQTDFLLKQKIPDLYFRFKEENVLLHDFMVSWIMTLFTCQVRFRDLIV